MKRKLAWVLIGFFALIASGLVFLYFTRPEADVINLANCARIKKGMTKLGVEVILEKPAEIELAPFPPSANTVCVWPGIRGEILVEFDPAGLVMSAKYASSASSFFDKLRMWLGW